jgi:hypothetical protein
MSVSEFIVSLDLGQTADPTALGVNEVADVPEKKDGPIIRRHTIRTLRRWELGTSYVSIVNEVKDRLSRPPLQNAKLVVDGTGVGRGIVDMFRVHPLADRLIPVTVTAGNNISFTDEYWRVPKREIAAILQRVLQQRRIEIADVPDREVLVKEMQNFKVKISNAGSELFAADWREGTHDDLVFAVGLVTWWGEFAATSSGPIFFGRRVGESPPSSFGAYGWDGKDLRRYGLD